MCGIAGYLAFRENHGLQPLLQRGISAMKLRGPDLQQSIVSSPTVGLAHARLSIIDTSSVANQPMIDPSGRYTIVFNGEVFNFRELRESYLKDVKFTSHSDTEVLLHLFIKFGIDSLQHLNGFFAFAVHDNVSGEVFLARDRYGIKPLVIYLGDSFIGFASEVKALLHFPIKREIDMLTLAQYLQLNYIPPDQSMLKGFSKIKPGECMRISKTGEFVRKIWYQIPYVSGKVISDKNFDYESSKADLKKLIEDSVARRLISDVPLGAFLSGGIDSSIVTACASKHTNSLNTFSIGFSDEPYFDETKYANLVAKKFKTNHTVFSISNYEMFANVFDILNYIDEPFADSSAIAVYILSQKTKQKVTVALSGDGGDELFGGYNKHRAELRAREKSILNLVVRAGLPIYELLPKSRHGKFGNLVRQLQRFSEGAKLSNSDRYWKWCGFNTESFTLSLLKYGNKVDTAELTRRRFFLKDILDSTGDLNDLFLADMQLVLPGDMLTKVDLMSMANSLEVRVPLLDYTVVDFAFSLPTSFKLNKVEGKRILKDAFREELPQELFNRPKHGFEVPLLKWMRTGLRSLIEDDLLNDEFIVSQGIFNLSATQMLKQKLFSNNPGDVHATLWGLIVFQYWWKRTFSDN